MASPKRMVVGITGATGIIYGVRLLEVLRGLDVETHLVVSKAGEMTREHETDLSSSALRALASRHYGVGEIGAALASGSFRTMGMIIAPCTVRTLSEIATGVTDTLLTRAADVTLKERRRLILLVRESPLHAGHLRSMLAVTEMGCIVAPPVPAFYTRPQTIGDIVDQTVGRVLDLFDFDTGAFPRWGESSSLLCEPRRAAGPELSSLTTPK